MIFLKHNKENTIGVTLTEFIPSGTTAPISGDTGSTYCLILTNLQDDSVYEFNLNDISTNPVRYNEFKLYIDSSLPSGYYGYVFRIKNPSTNEYLTDALEIGKCLVELPTLNNITYTSDTNNIIVYKS